MKAITLTLLLLGGAFFAAAQTNYPILSLEEIGATTIIEDEPIMLCVENIGEVPNLAFYNLEKKELMQRFSARLPENTVSHVIPCDNGLLYLLTIRRGDDDGYPMFDAIYSFDYKKDKLQKVYTENEVIPMPSGASAVHSKLVLSGRVFHEQPRIFNLDTKAFEVLSDDKSLRVLCTSYQHNSYVVIKFSELTEDDSFPIYVLDKAGKLSESVGLYDSRMVASTNEKENRMPGFTITNPKYNWVETAFDNSGFPLWGFAIAMHPGLAAQYSNMANLYDIQKIEAANQNYMAASGAGGQFWVYNTKTPNSIKQQTVSNEDLEAIQSYFEEKTEYTKISLQSAALAEVFGAKFYSLTERMKLGDSGYTESSFIVFAQNENYAVLKEKAQLTELLKPAFKLDSETKAAQFQDALNALYPPDTFAKKHIQCFKKENCWNFVRDESFGDKKGFIVQLNESNTITQIKYSEKLN